VRRLIALTVLAMQALSAIAATKDSGATTLKDVQPAGTVDKNHKHQQYDLSFASATGKDYTCRTSAKASVKATDFVVGNNVNYQVNGDKGKIKTPAGKELSCTVVRVANGAAPPK
jgi:hypothetical protein